MALRHGSNSIRSIFTAMPLLLLTASVAAQEHGLFPTALGTGGLLGHPQEELCNDGYGIFKCADPDNCTAITGEVSCCENSRDAVASRLSKGNCGLRQEKADGACLTSVVCAPLSTHYTAIIPVAIHHLTHHGITVATYTTNATKSTVENTQTTRLAYTGGATATTATMAHSATSNATVATTSSTYTNTETAETTEASSFSYVELADRKPIKGTTIGGILVGVLAGASLLLLALYLLFRRWKLRRDNRNPKNRGVLAGPRVPTGSTVAASLYRRDGSDSWNTPPKSERSQPVGDLEANVGQQDIGLQYYSESNYSRTDGPASSKTAKEPTPGSIDDNTSACGSPARHAQIFTSLEPAENEASTLHSRRSNTTIDWPLPKSTVSSPGLLMNAPKISPMSPLSPFGNFDAVREQVEEQAEKEKHRQDAYRNLTGEEAGAALTKKPGSVSRARQNMVAPPEPLKKAGSVARARQNIVAARGAAEQPGRVTSPRQNTVGLVGFLRELDGQCGDEADVETNETGTVIRRKNKRPN